MNAYTFALKALEILNFTHGPPALPFQTQRSRNPWGLHRLDVYNRYISPGKKYHRAYNNDININHEMKRKVGSRRERSFIILLFT